jgi:hypothetical protein
VIEITLVYEPAAGAGCYRSRVEDDEPDRILRLADVDWDALGRPTNITLTIEALQVDGP